MDADARGAKGAEALPCGAGGTDHDGIGRQPLETMALRYLIAQHGAHRALDISNRQFKFNRQTAFDGRPAFLDQELIQGGLETMVLVLNGAVIGNDLGQFGFVKNFGKVQPLSFPMVNRLADIEAVNPADHLTHGPEAELGHDFSEILGDKIH